MRWAERLSEFLPGASLHYKAGRENLVPDALSRRPDFLAALKLATEDGFPLAFCNSVVSPDCFLVLQSRRSVILDGGSMPIWLVLEMGNGSFWKQGKFE